MLWVPQKGRLLVENTGGAVADSYRGGTAVTTHASDATAKGTVVELIASTQFDAYLITVIAVGYAAPSTATPGALDILIGSATEDVLIPNLLMGNCGYPNDGSGPGNDGKKWAFPLYVPAGSRIAAQVAGARLSTSINVTIILHGGHGLPPFRVGRKVTTYGMGTVPNGTSITTGSSAQGSFTQITASTSEDHFAFMPSFQANDTVLNPTRFVVQIGVGAATEDVIGTWQYVASNLELLDGPQWPFPAFVDVPSGTRLAMRASQHGGLDTVNGVIHAVS